MYRISRVFETSCVEIMKIAGQVTHYDLNGWSEFLQELEREDPRWIVLDFCDVSRVDGKAAEMLLRMAPRQVLLLNCPMAIQNMAAARGMCQQVLESNRVGVSQLSSPLTTT